MRNSPNEKELSPAGKYAKEHWVGILAASGTLIGAVIYLLIQYNEKRKEISGHRTDTSQLDSLAEEALKSDYNSVPVLLDVMGVVQAEISDLEKLSMELAEGLPEEVEGKPPSKWFKLLSPKQVMRELKNIK